MLGFNYYSFADDTAIKQVLQSSDAVVWAGLDYSMVRMIENSDTIKVPDLIFQNMPEKWNDLFIDERLEGVANSLGKSVFIDIAGVTERNKMLNTNQVIISPDFVTIKVINQSHIAKEDIAAAVQSYKMEHKSGVGLVFIVDRMVCFFVGKPSTFHGDSKNFIHYAESVYVVFFDIATRKVISSKREVHYVETSGSFSHFWFGPIKDTDTDLSRYRY